MSRRLPPTHRHRGPHTADNNYQTSTLPAVHHYQKNGHFPKDLNGKPSSAYRGAPCEDLDAHDTCFSDDTFTDTNTYYEYYQTHGYQGKKLPEAEYYSDDSGSTRLPYYEYEDVSVKRHSRNAFSDGSYNHKAPLYRNNKLNQIVVHKDVRRVYPNQENAACERLCPENQRCIVEAQQAIPVGIPKRAPISRLSERSASSQSSGVTSVIVHGCGGRCQTFENVCYYLMQVAFTMGILIGTSLSLAGALLRKSAARNLQVLVYIGALLSLVSALLLGVQCSARNGARKRKQALRNAKRAPIPLDLLQNRNVPVPQQQPLILGDNNLQRSLPSAMPLPVSQVHPRLQQSVDVSMLEQPGVPWWRRKDLVA